jgi:beta-glucanase (GH16 family)
MQSPIIGSTLDAGFSGIEVDVMESFHPGCVDLHVLHYNGYSVDYKSKVTGAKHENLNLDEFHTFGVLWEEDGYTFFIDGVQDGEKITDPVSHIPQFILISTEVNGYRTKERTATIEAIAAAKAGDTFMVDHVRVFDIVK